MSERKFDLKTSITTFGVLVPVIKNKKTGHVIDGKHRALETTFYPVHEIDIPEEYEPIARLIINNVRRDADADETEWQEILKQVQEQKITPEKLAELTGIHKSTIYRHMPKEMKPLGEAISEGLKEAYGVARQEVATATPTVKTSDIKECERCHVAGETKVWNSHNLCLGHYTSALENPAQMKRYFQLRDEETKKHTAETKPITPHDLDSWQHREAQMHPQHSRQEQEFVKLCQDDDALRPVIQDRPFYAVRSVPDAFLPRHNAVVYVDGPPHIGHEEEDEKLRQAIAEANNVKVFVFKIGDGKPEDWRKQLKEKL